MNDLQIYENQSFGELRTLIRDGEPWFVAADVCRALEITNPRDAVSRLDDDEKMTVGSTDGHSGKRGGAQSFNVVNEPGLYTLILGSRKPEARAFKRWITHEVIPAIRKTGVYSTGSKAEAGRLRAQAMLMNAQTRQFNAIMQTIADKSKLAPVAIEVFGLKTLEHVMGANVGNYLPEIEKTYSATEIAGMYGVTSTKIGKLANVHGLKTAEYGRYVLDKSPYSAKEVEAFRYNSRGVERIGQILGSCDSGSFQ